MTSRNAVSSSPTGSGAAPREVAAAEAGHVGAEALDAPPEPLEEDSPCTAKRHSAVRAPTAVAAVA